MNYEQRYKEILEAVKELQEANLSDDGIQNWVNEKFPELREPEDERVRKLLIDYFNRYKEQEECGINTFYGIPTDNILAWLEKPKSEEINVKALLTADKLAAAEMTGRLKERKDIVENPQKYGLEKQGEQKPVDSYCQENCKGFQETGKCFTDGDCKAKREAERR